MTVSVEICNLALGDIRAPRIADIAEDSVEAGNCATFYPHCLALLLDDYDWQFLKRTASLALYATNERATEWAYAYALPDDCGKALRLIPGDTSAVDTTTTWIDVDVPYRPAFWTSFIIENGVLYSNLSDVTLEYASNAADESVFPPLFKEALRRLLGANLAVPIRDSRELENDLLKMAEAARQKAIAADMNRAPRSEMLDDVGHVRRG